MRACETAWCRQARPAPPPRRRRAARANSGEVSQKCHTGRDTSLCRNEWLGIGLRPRTAKCHGVTSVDFFRTWRAGALPGRAKKSILVIL